MKYLALAIFSVSVLQVMAHIYQPIDYISDIFRIPAEKVVTDMVRDKCHELEKKFRGLEKCYSDINKTETICSAVKDKLMNCVNPVSDYMDECLKSTKYQDMPKFILDMLNSVSTYICQTKGENLIELIHPCITTLGYEKADVCLKSFKKKIENIEKDDTIKNVKTDICKSLLKTKTCFLGEFKSVCPNEVTLKSAVGFYDAVITKPCKHI